MCTQIRWRCQKINLNSILALDNFDIATKIKGDLQRRGIDVFSFTNPDLIFQHFKINAAIYGLIMSDFKMPRMNGFEFLSNVKKIRPYIQVFLMSAFQIRDIEYSNFLQPTTKIDEFIQKHQLEETRSEQVLEWIPYEWFTDVEYLTEGGFGKIYKAKWTNGNIINWNIKDNRWEREGDKEKFLCDKCIFKLYYQNKSTYWKLVPNLKKRQIMRSYIYLKSLNNSLKDLKMKS